MVRVIGTLLIALLYSGIVLADEHEGAAVPPPPEIDLNAPTETRAVTIYKSKVFPGFRACTPEDYRNQDYDPIACQDDEAARVLSIHAESDQRLKGLVVEEDAMSQGNIYKLRFERFIKKKQ